DERHAPAARDRPHDAARTARRARVGGVLPRPDARAHGGLLSERDRHRRARIVDERGVAVALASGPGLSRASVPPGHYTFGLDVYSGGVLGRIPGTVTVPHFARGSSPLLSTLILGATDSSGDGGALLAAMSSCLAYR